MASSSTIFGTLPSGDLFSFPPNSDPAFFPPPTTSSMPSGAPWSISPRIYQAALDPKVPLTVAAFYAATVSALNKYNRSTGKKPWAISQSRFFFAFVVFHNVFLAVYSAWTWWGMLGALRRSIVSPTGPDGWAGTVDSFCKLHGPPGLGNAAFYSEDANQWRSYQDNTFLTTGPSRTQPGRMWNEGLAFYGWIFYLSKFYEVLDTFVILAKGKLSSTLQTYHHAGAMMCMWAGMRYMSPPIWMFVFVNSGIHAMMYTYYTITAFSVKVPTAIKRTLTSLQITQFLVGASYAMAHSFISYAVPVVFKSAKLSTSTTALPAPGEIAQPPALLDNVKNMIFGAASQPSPAAAATPDSAAVRADQTVVVPCVGTTGETFAIWLNVLYLAPLTYLFVKFFITSYLRRSSAESARAKKVGGAGEKGRRFSNVTLAEKAGWDAAKDLEKEVYGEKGEAEAVFVEDARAQPPAARARRANGRSTKK